MSCTGSHNTASMYSVTELEAVCMNLDFFYHGAYGPDYQ